MLDRSSPLLALSLVMSLAGCIDPNVQVAGSGAYVPSGPAPEQGEYRCTLPSGGPCAPPKSRMWMPGWIVIEMAARGTKAAFSALPTLPKGGAEYGTSQYLGQVDLESGSVDWIVPLGAYHDDFRTMYDLEIAPNGDVVIGGAGYGETLLGEKVGQADGVIAVFDSIGKKRFARRMEIWDQPPTARPGLINLKIVTNDAIYVQTAFHSTEQGQPTIAPVHLFAFDFQGNQKYRKAVPIEPGSFNGSMMGAPDGSMWIRTYPGPFRRYSKDGEVLATLSVSADADIRGFAATEPTTLLVNFTTKGYTNELHRFDVEGVLFPLFNEPALPGFHAAEIVNSIGFARTYLAAWELAGSGRAVCHVDSKGNRGPVSKVLGINGRFEALDDDRGVFFRHANTGTEWIVQPLP